MVEAIIHHDLGEIPYHIDSNKLIPFLNRRSLSLPPPQGGVTVANSDYN
jgi:hypothetical protein